MTEHDTGTELAVYQPPTNRTVDLRDHATDSWTDVLDDVIQLARGIANTEFVPVGLRGSIEKVSAAVLYSRELGLPPMTGLSGTHVIEGKAGISAELMRALILQAGHELAIKESTAQRCEIWGRRRGQEEWTKAVWTIQEAHNTQVFVSKDKGWGPLSSKSQWRSWPTEMLLARATTRLARQIFPDVTHGMRSVEELEDMTTVEEVAGPAVQQMPEPATVQRKRAPRPAPRAPQEAEAPSAEETAPESPPEAPAAEPRQTVQRKRVKRPEPRPAPPAPAPEPVEEAAAATVDELPDDDGVVDAEVVDDAPLTEEEEAPLLTEQQKKILGLVKMHWKRLVVEQREEQLWYTGIILKLEAQPSSHKDLSVEQLRTLLNTLERAKDITAINALIEKREGGESK